MHYLTEDQYDTMFVPAHNLCNTCLCKNQKQAYPYLDQLIDYAAMFTGKYPEPEVIMDAWEKARGTDGKGSKEDSEMIMEALIGPFTYNKKRTTKPWYELAEEELRTLLKERDANKTVEEIKKKD